MQLISDWWMELSVCVYVYGVYYMCVQCVYRLFLCDPSIHLICFIYEYLFFPCCIVLLRITQH